MLPLLAALLLHAPADPIRVEIRFASSARTEPLTGRAYVAFAHKERPNPVDQTSSTGAPLFAVDVSDLAPGKPAVIDASTFGHPVESLADLPAGEYFAQGFFNVYTRYDRADGKTIWAHADRWEGQDWKRSPGNLFSKPVKVALDPKKGGTIALECTEVIPPIALPNDTANVKHLFLQSTLLTKFWGRKVELGATVLLPKGFDEHPSERYPVVYEQDHFSLRAPGGYGRGGKLDKFWDADDSPRFLLVRFQHPTPFYDDSYAVNSANNGPYGDAIIQELIPEVEKRFRAVGEPWARTLTGGSTGGWEALALQVFHPDFFNGCWSLFPDSLDFRAHQIVNIYKDDNAYFVEHEFMKVDRPDTRQVDGNIMEMMKDENRYELVCGERSRSGGQWDGWEAVFSPCGDDGYPKRLWDKRTGKIDHAVAETWKGYDLRAYCEKNWKTIGPSLRGKIKIWVGEDDTYYLENGVRFMEKFLEKADPPYEGHVEYGPNAPHGYGPELTVVLNEMAERIEKTAPAGSKAPRN